MVEVTDIPGVSVTPLKIFTDERGSVLHALRKDDPEFIAFGEVYFSTVRKGVVKGWKRHREMTLNVVVPVGAVRFHIVSGKETTPLYRTIVLSPEHYIRLTIAPGHWVAFQGLSDLNLLCNISDIVHNSEEAEVRELTDAAFPRLL